LPKRPSRPKAKQQRRRARNTPDGVTRLRWTLAFLWLVMLLGAVPPLRGLAMEVQEALYGGAVRVGGSVMNAWSASRRTEAHRAEVEALAEQYGIPLELARAIDRAADAEGVDAELAFRLVKVESEFHERAVSSAGALGLTQLMPATAEWLQPGITEEEIFDRDTNLRLGFRYLRLLIREYDGRVDEALHAYNRGPGTVDRIRATGGDPANGYAERVLGREGGDEYQGNGLTAGAGLHAPE